jgi:response regulator RpfG family c-di-GMP phosphodiesterase
MDENVLIVDDDPEILNSFRRNFYKKFHLDTASGPADGLKLLKSSLYWVVISDYQMPQMNGIRFLTLVREISPDTTRIMLTGNADIRTAINAVNEGHIFRFLSKPCTPEAVEQAIQAGIDYYKLITAERVLLEQTLNGSISMLVEILSLVNPVAFSRAARTKKIVAHVVRKLNILPAWYFELAATLSQIGFVALPPYLLDKIYQQQELTDLERVMLNNHPLTACKLIEKIPRLEIIAPMIADQQKPFSDYSFFPGSQLPKEPAILGAQLLKVALDYDTLSSGGHSHPDIMRILESRKGTYNLLLLSAIGELVSSSSSLEHKKVAVYELDIGMIVDEDITTVEGMLLLRRGQEITETVITRLHNINSHSRIKEPFQVLIQKKG